MKREEYRNAKGEIHRIDGPAYINGDRQEWWINNALHKVDGPAMIQNNIKIWVINSKKVNPNNYTNKEIYEYNHILNGV